MILALLCALVSTAVFAGGLYACRVVPVARQLSDEIYKGIGAITDTQLSDEMKEQAVQRAGLALLRGAWSIFWRFAVILSLTYLPVWAADQAGIVSEQNTFAVLLRVDYLVLVSLALVIAAWWVSRRKTSRASADTHTSYDTGDRILHMIAFASPLLQRLMARIDDFAFAIFCRQRTTTEPLFITSLARGGTTALLNALSSLPGVAAHTYRDMPFITAPFLWNRLTAPFKRRVTDRERAHGDGLRINLDSPEAFDEVYWQLYWPEKYGRERIAPWQPSDLKPGPLARMRACFAKIPVVRSRPGARYVSKNNANIARLDFIAQAFPGARVVVPLRRPAAHAASLHRQHINFLRQHSEDDFTRRYMRDIGHLEFGLLHKPIAFDGFAPSQPADSPDYWLEYWIAAFTAVLSHASTCTLVSQDDLRADANGCMNRLLSELGLGADGRDFSSYFHTAPDTTDAGVFSPDLLSRAEALYDRLAALSV